MISPLNCGALEGGSWKNDLAKVSINSCDLAAFKGRVCDLAEHIVSVYWPCEIYMCFHDLAKKFDDLANVFSENDDLVIEKREETFWEGSPVGEVGKNLMIHRIWGDSDPDNCNSDQM